MGFSLKAALRNLQPPDPPAQPLLSRPMSQSFESIVQFTRKMAKHVAGEIATQDGRACFSGGLRRSHRSGTLPVERDGPSEYRKRRAGAASHGQRNPNTTGPRRHRAISLDSGLLISWKEDKLGFEPKQKKTNLATDGHGFTRIRKPVLCLYPCESVSIRGQICFCEDGLSQIPWRIQNYGRHQVSRE